MNHRRVVKTTDRPTTPYCAGPHVVKHIYRVVPLDEDDHGTAESAEASTASVNEGAFRQTRAMSEGSDAGEVTDGGTQKEELDNHQFKRQLMPVPDVNYSALNSGYGFSKLGSAGYDVLNTHLHFAKRPIDPSRRVIAPHIIRYYRIKELLDRRKDEESNSIPSGGQIPESSLDVKVGLPCDVQSEETASKPIIQHLSHFRRHSDTRALFQSSGNSQEKAGAVVEEGEERLPPLAPQDEEPHCALGEDSKRDDSPVSTSTPLDNRTVVIDSQRHPKDSKPVLTRPAHLLRRQPSGAQISPGLLKNPRQLLSLQRSHARHKSQSFIQTSSSANSMPTSAVSSVAPGSYSGLVAPLSGLSTKPLVRAASSGAAYYAAKKLRIMTHHKRKCSISPPPTQRHLEGVSSFPTSAASSAVSPSPALSFLSSIAERTSLGFAVSGIYEEGDEIGPYVLGPELGVGTFARVYAAYRTDLDEEKDESLLAGSMPGNLDKNISFVESDGNLRSFASAPELNASKGSMDIPSGVAPPALMGTYEASRNLDPLVYGGEPMTDESDPLASAHTPPAVLQNSVGSTGAYSVNLTGYSDDMEKTLATQQADADNYYRRQATDATESVLKQQRLVNEMAPRVRKCAIKIVPKPVRRSLPQRHSGHYSFGEKSPVTSYVVGGSLGRNARISTLGNENPQSGSGPSTGRSQMDTFNPFSPTSFEDDSVVDAEVDMMERDTQRLLDHEITIWSNLHHPNIVEMYGVLENDEATFVLAELCEGGSLLDYISKAPNAFLAEVEAKRLFRQLAEAVNYLHNDRGLVHRDIKLENILLTGDGTLKLGDLGLSDFVEDPIQELSSVGSPSDDEGDDEESPSVEDMDIDGDVETALVDSVHSALSSSTGHSRAHVKLSTPQRTVDLEPGSVSLTDSSCMTSPTGPAPQRAFGSGSGVGDRQNSPVNSGTDSFQEPNTVYAAGSVHYCAPEELTAASPSVCPTGKNFVSDIWSMACVLWAMLTGGIPFNDDFLPRLQMFIIHAKIPWHQLHCCQRVSSEAEDLLRHCFEPDPSKRYSIQQVLRSEWLSEPS